MSLLFSTSTIDKNFIFESTIDKEKFIIALETVHQKLKPSPILAPSISSTSSPLIDFSGLSISTSPALPPRAHTPPMPSVSSHPSSTSTSTPLKIFVGTINHNETQFQAAQDSFEGSIPRDRDLYILGCQNCYYRVPAGFYFAAGSHWIFMIQQYLGKQFEIIKIASLSNNRLVTAIFVRKELKFSISNVELSYSILSLPRVVDGSVASSSSSPSSSKNSKGFGGFIRSLTSEVKKGLATTPGDSSSGYSESDYTGIGWSLFVLFFFSRVFIDFSLLSDFFTFS